MLLNPKKDINAELLRSTESRAWERVIALVNLNLAHLQVAPLLARASPPSVQEAV
jgi:hypothetical protein